MAHYPAVPEAQASVPRIEKNKMVYLFYSMIFSFSFWFGLWTFYWGSMDDYRDWFLLYTMSCSLISAF